MARTSNSRRELRAMISTELDVRLRWMATQMGLDVSSATAVLIKEAIDNRQRQAEREQARRHR